MKTSHLLHFGISEKIRWPPIFPPSINWCLIQLAFRDTKAGDVLVKILALCLQLFSAVWSFPK